MRKTNIVELSQPKFVGLQRLKSELGCGRVTAEKVAAAAGARHAFGGRIFYDLAACVEFVRSQGAKE